MTKTIANFCYWLLGAFQYLAILTINFGVDVINFAIVSVASVFEALISLFPDSNINVDPPPELIAIAHHVNWFLPMDSIVGAMTIICGAYILYFSIRPIAKFLHIA